MSFFEGRIGKPIYFFLVSFLPPHSKSKIKNKFSKNKNKKTAPDDSLWCTPRDNRGLSFERETIVTTRWRDYLLYRTLSSVDGVYKLGVCSSKIDGDAHLMFLRLQVKQRINWVVFSFPPNILLQFVSFLF